MKRLIAAACVLASLLVVAPVAADKPRPRIVSGAEVAQTTYPFQVALFDVGRFSCGGAILNATTVVTAAHCVTEQFTDLIHPAWPASDYTVGYGAGAVDQTTTVDVASIAVMNAYSDFPADESYDVAILRLASPIPFGPNAQPIPIASPQQVKTAGSAIVSGWGTTSEGGDLSPVLLGARLPLQADALCQAAYSSDYVASRHVCAGGQAGASNNPDTCQGDSGGPIMINLAGAVGGTGAAPRFALLGVTSFGRGCGRQYVPGVYTLLQGQDIASFVPSASYQTSETNPGDPCIGVPGSAGGVRCPDPPPVQVARDSTAPTLRFSSFSCTKKRRCTLRVKAADNSGVVAGVQAALSRKVTSCKKRRGKRRKCKKVTRRKQLKPRAAAGGFKATAKLKRGRYTLTAVAVDGTGNRSATLRRKVRVKR